MKRLTDMISDSSAWLVAQTQAQDKQALHEDPVLTEDQLQRKSRLLSNVAAELLRTKKPYTNTTKANATVINATKANSSAKQEAPESTPDAAADAESPSDKPNNADNAGGSSTDDLKEEL